MRINSHAGEHPSSFRARLVLLVIAVVAGAFIAGFTEAPARAGTSGNTQVTQITIDLAALPLENLCNGDTVNLHGQETITSSTTPTSNGGLQVVSDDRATNLTGQRILPAPMYPYTGGDTTDSYSYIAPAPYPTTYSGRHWTKLTPQFNAPAMWLVVVTREVISADGTAIPSVERAYLSCSQPTTRDCHRES